METSLQRVSIISHSLRAGGGVSVGKNLIASLCLQYRHARYQIFVPEGLGYQEVVPPDIHCECIPYQSRLGLLGRWLFDEVMLVAAIRRFAPDVVLCLGNLGLTRTLAPQVLLVQDAHLFYPERHYGRITPLARLGYLYRKQRLARDLRRSVRVLCQTETARTRIRQCYGYSGDIEVLQNAISPELLSDAALPQLPPQPDPHGRFRLFYLTRYYPHKNIELLVECFRRYGAQLRDVVLYLTIAPDQHSGARRILEQIRDPRLAPFIVNLGPLSQRELVARFRSSDALVMPSLLESFSGTYIEAMALGCPILTSDLDFARGICRDAAVYFDPWSTESLLEAVKRVRDNHPLRSSLVERGRRVLVEHGTSWQENARKLQGLLRNANRIR